MKSTNSGTVSPKFSFEEALQSQETSLLKIYTSYTLERLGEMLSKNGIQISPPSPVSWRAFAALSTESRTATAQRIVNYAQLVSEFVEQEIDLGNNVELLKYFFKKRGVKVSDRFFSDVTNEDVVEVYNGQHEQLFRNFRFLELTDYDLLLLESEPWFKLFGRHEKITRRLVELATESLASDREIISADVETHPTQEFLSERQKILSVRFKSFAPILRDDKAVGFILNEEVSLVEADGKQISFIRK